MKRKVVFAKLHDIKVVLTPVGQLETNLPPNGKSYPGLEMYYDGAILNVKIAGNECGIPMANVQFMKFAPEEVETSAKPKVVKAS